jgi:hypothetical protein
MLYLPLLSTIISFIFAASVLSRWRYKHPNHLLLWGIGLIFYGLGTLSEVILSINFSLWVLKLWYLTGAMLTAAWLGQGTVYLLVRRKKIAHGLMILLVATSLLALFMIVSAPLAPSAPLYNSAAPASEQYKDILVRNSPTIILTILLNIYGTITLVGGALYSAYLFWRKSILVQRMWGNIFIAAGALLPATGGSYLMAGLADWLYLSELLGVILMYIGFRLATATQPVAAPAAAAAD